MEMWRCLTLLGALMLAVPSASQQPCPDRPQPLPDALESHGLPPIERFRSAFEFAAEPSLEYPGRAWVIRLEQGIRSRTATLTVVRLRRRNECNIYDTETTWSGQLSASEFVEFSGVAGPLISPPTDLNAPFYRTQRGPIVLDGTGIEARIYGAEWTITRLLNHFAPGGVALSAAFRSLAARIVPPEQMPSEDWRTSTRRR